MTVSPETGGPGGPRTVLVAHPSADLYGSDRVMLETVSALVAAGWDVTVTVPGPGPLTDLVEERGGRVLLCETVVLRKSLLSPTGLLRLARQAVTAARAGRRLVRQVRPAAVVVNTVTVPMWLVVARACWVPVMCHVHEAEGSAAGWKRALLGLPITLADHVVANSRYSVAVVGRSYPAVARRAQVIPNGVPGPERARPPRTTLDGAVRLVYVGRLSPRKGVDVAVDAVAHLAERGIGARLDLVGAVFPGYEWYEAELRDQVARLGLTQAVTFHGFQPRVWDMVAAADVVLVPSRADEPFGNTAVEAVLAGRPVVASATSGLLEATDGYGSARTVTPGDPGAVADAVAAIVQDWQAVSAAARADVDTAVQRHDPPVYRRAMAAAVEGLLR